MTDVNNFTHTIVLFSALSDISDSSLFVLSMDSITHSDSM